MTKPTWTQYADQLAERYSPQIDFLYGNGHVAVDIEWRGGPCTGIVADLGTGQHLVATNNTDGSALAEPGEEQDDWLICIYNNADNSEPVADAQAADFKDAYRAALGALKKDTARDQ